MNKLGLAKLSLSRWRGTMGLFLSRSSSTGAKNSPRTHEHTLHEIKGSIYTLVTLFLLVSLTSYLPLDTFNLTNGRLDHINNMGGLVGAVLGEVLLGSIGIMGHSFIILTAWMSLLAFRGKAFRTRILQMTGLLLSSFLGAMACHLIWGLKVPEASLLQGGLVGRYIGGTLESLCNTTGALLIVGTGFVITFILTTHLSMVRFVRRAFGDPEEDEIEEVAEELAPQPKLVAIAKSTTAAPNSEKPVAVETTKPAKRSRKKKEVSKEETPNENSETLDSAVETEGASAEEVPAEPQADKLFSCNAMVPFKGAYSLPSTRLLKNPPGQPKKLSKGELKETIQKLNEHLLSFQITGEIVSVSQGPVLTTFEYKPSAGIKLSKIAALQDDLGVVLGTRELRIVAPIPGKTVVGIEIPRPQAEVIALKDCLNDKDYSDKKLRIPVALGRTTDGKPVFADLVSMPHLLVAGATGSGKSVFVNSLIMSFLFRMSPQQLRMILVDPKMLELNVFDGLPHLISPVITDNKIAFNALSWAVWEMERRYSCMAQTGSKNIDSYNEKQKNQTDKLPFIVIVVDELADLMMSGGEMVEVAITRLAQKARAAGIHLVIATQRPSTDVITGLIKANIPSRLSFKVPSGIDSRTVLDTSGAEELIGRGDSLMIQPAVPLRRLHGTFVTEDELARTVKYCKGGKDYSEFYIDFSGKNPDQED